MNGFDAVCLDFYNTLAVHRDGRGRGKHLMEYLNHHGFETDPWTHQVLYDVFEPHGREYSPTHAPEVKHAYYCRLASRVFERLSVRAPKEVAVDHAEAIWGILGPSAFILYPETPTVLRSVKQAGLRTAVVSNWQCGLAHFCAELGLRANFDHVIASAEFGAGKPHPTIFLEACRRLRTSPTRTLHVGDTFVDDIEGARKAGLRAVLIDRSANTVERSVERIASLEELLPLLEGLN